MSAVLYEVDARGVATVTLNRPAVGNAYDAALLQGLIDVFARLASDDGCRLAVLRGAGRHFQAGADLGWLRAVASGTADENAAASRLTVDAVRHLNEFPRPTVALVHGACFGGGTGIAAACDIVIAAEDARFAVAEARWGLTAGPILPQLVAAMGSQAARRYALSAERFGAAEALATGLVHQVCPADGLDAAGAAMVETLLLNGPGAMRACKDVLLDLGGLRVSDEAADAMAATHAARRQSAEAAEGLAAFAGKRPPSWQGA
ncbi:MAG: enoyl-CoA hydratase-related protein [Alphaproteobacteria bacterium]